MHPWETDGDDDKPWDGSKNDAWRGDVHTREPRDRPGQWKDVDAIEDGDGEWNRIVGSLCARIAARLFELHVLYGSSASPRFLVISVPDYEKLVRLAQRTFNEDVATIGELDGLEVVASPTQFNGWASIKDDGPEQRILAVIEIGRLE